MYGYNGASIEECKLLEEELAYFCQLVDTEILRKKYQYLIEDCQYHFKAYPKYLENLKKYSSYKEFINQMDF